MKTRILQSAILLCASAALAQPIQVVVPGSLANVEGNSSASEPFDSTSFRFQQVFDASQFSIPPGTSGRVEQISFRLDGASTEEALLYFGGSSVQLSTTQRAPDGLSDVFAENRGSDARTVWNGPIAFGGDPPPASGVPAPFDPTIPTATASVTPFYYIPAQGNLLLEVTAGSGQAFLPGALDAQSVSGDSVSWVFADAAGATAGTAETLGLITRFDIAVIPEPATWCFGILGAMLFFVLRRR